MDEMWGKIAKMEREWEKVGKVVGSKPGEVCLDLNKPASLRLNNQIPVQLCFDWPVALSGLSES